MLGTLLLAACSDPATFVPEGLLGGPKGAITGSVVFTGPAPCTRKGHVIGAAVVLAFREDALPPPDGFATAPEGIAVVTGDDLFQGGDIAFSSDGSALCPSPVASFISTSSPFELAPLDAARYQLRGFFDRDGDFNPAFSLFNLPTRGDVAGGAVENPVEALGGAAPHFRSLVMGVPGADGALTIPVSGARLDGVSVNLGISIPVERPMFHLKKTTDGGARTPSPKTFEVPADYTLDTFDTNDPAATEASFLRLTFLAGFPENEAVAGKAKPFSLPLNDATFTLTREDANRDGVRDALDHIPESSLIPSLAPLAWMTRLEDGSALVGARPVVLLQGLTLLDSLTDTALSKPELHVTRTSLTVALRPAELCVDPREPTKAAILLLTHEQDKHGHALLPNAKAALEFLSKRLGRKAEVAYGCLRQGNYAMNLVYETGQAWTVPNEAGSCAVGEAPSEDGTRCGARARLASQGEILRVGPPDDAAYCLAHPTPAACIQ